MNTPELLHSLTMEGLTLRCAGCESLEVTGPLDRLTAPLQASLAEHKPELLALLGCGNAEALTEREAIESEPRDSAEAASFDPDEFSDDCPGCGRFRYWNLAERRDSCEECDASPKRLIGQGFPHFDVAAYQRRLLDPFEREPFPISLEWPCHKCGAPAYRGAFGRRYCLACGLLGKAKHRLADFGDEAEGEQGEGPACESAKICICCHSRPLFSAFRKKGASKSLCLNCWEADNESEAAPGLHPEAASNPHPFSSKG